MFQCFHLEYGYHIFTTQNEDRLFEGHHARFYCPKTSAADVHFFAQKQVKTKEKKGHQVRGCPFFCSKTSEDQKKRSSRP